MNPIFLVIAGYVALLCLVELGFLYGWFRFSRFTDEEDE